MQIKQIFKTQGHHHNQGNGLAKGPVPQNTIPQNTEFDLPKPGTDVKKKAIDRSRNCTT